MLDFQSLSRLQVQQSVNRNAPGVHMDVAMTNRGRGESFDHPKAIHPL